MPQENDAGKPCVVRQRFRRHPRIRREIIQRHLRHVERALGSRHPALVVAQRRNAALGQAPRELRVGVWPDAHQRIAVAVGGTRAGNDHGDRDASRGGARQRESPAQLERAAMNRVWRLHRDSWRRGVGIL